jgi:hypothetical protein
MPIEDEKIKVENRRYRLDGEDSFPSRGLVSISTAILCPVVGFISKLEQ